MVLLQPLSFFVSEKNTVNQQLFHISNLSLQDDKMFPGLIL